MTYSELVRWAVLDNVYARMTEEEKQQIRLYLLQQRGHREVMDALGQQRTQIERMAAKIERQSWLTDFGSDVAANFLTDGLILIARRLFRKI